MDVHCLILKKERKLTGTITKSNNQIVSFAIYNLMAKHVSLLGQRRHCPLLPKLNLKFLLLKENPRHKHPTALFTHWDHPHCTTDCEEVCGGVGGGGKHQE